MMNVRESYIDQLRSFVGSLKANVGRSWDRFGFVASSLCAVHCICLPWLVLAMPFLSRSLVADPFVERVFVMGSVGLAMLCALVGFKRTGSGWPLILVSVGALTLLYVHATAPPSCCAREIEWTQALGSGFGGGMLAASHFVGIRLSRRGNDTSQCQAADCCCARSDDAGA
jgi:hypothetical protein